MMYPAMLLAMGLAMLLWRPCRTREGRAPRAAIILLMASAAAVWLGSFGLVVSIVAGHNGRVLAACGAAWQKIVLGEAGLWQSGLLLAWIVALPVRGVWTTAGHIVASQRLLRRLAPLTTGDAVVRGSGTGLLVPGLTTPAVTLGLLRPVVLVDVTFWSSATTTERAIVLAHEDAHRGGHHGLVDALVGVLTAGLSPLPAAGEAFACVRRHLEALADDVAARRHGPQTVGVTLGRVALGAAPAGGLGAAGSALWRVHRLVAPNRSSSWRDRGLLGANVLLMVVGLVVVAADTAQALSPLVNPQFCPL